MSYLSRGAGRLANPGRAAVIPAVPSRSPLALADQRLNIVGFAAMPPTVGAGGGDESADAAPSAASEEPRARRPAPARGSRVASAATATTASVASPPPRRPALADPVPAPPARRAADLGPPRDQGPPATHAGASESRAGWAVPALAVTPATTTAEKKTTPRKISRDPTHPQAVEPPDAPRRPASAIAALARALAWADSEPRPALATDRSDGSSAVGAQLTPRADPPTRSAPPASAGLAVPPVRAVEASRPSPVTRVEIGRIEVEIVPPPRPPQQPAVQRHARPAPRPLASPMRTFGWRQR